MKCANCEMLNQIPETNCSHCGRMMPALKPVFDSSADVESENAEGESSGVSAEEGSQEGQNEGEGQTSETEEVGESPTEQGQAETSQEAETASDAGSDAEEVTLEKGHVDNVGDDSESETVT